MQRYVRGIWKREELQSAPAHVVGPPLPKRHIAECTPTEAVEAPGISDRSTLGHMSSIEPVSTGVVGVQMMIGCTLCAGAVCPQWMARKRFRCILAMRRHVPSMQWLLVTLVLLIVVFGCVLRSSF